jgi:hypothetical protein
VILVTVSYGLVNVKAPSLARGRVGHFSALQSAVTCQLSVVFTVYMLLRDITMHMHVQYIQGICQSRLSTALALVIHATAAV